MSDDRIADYLRDRGRVEPPLDFVGSVMDAVADVPQQRASWFAPFLPAAVAVGAVAAVIALALLVNRPPPIGPPTASPVASQAIELSPAPTSAPARTFSPAATPTPGPTAELSQGPLLEPGDVARIPAVWMDKGFGTIALERGPDAGGYRLVPDPSSDSHFFIEIPIIYELERVPEGADWGGFDWTVQDSAGSVVAESTLVFAPPGQECRGLSQWPGATVPEDRFEGCLLFAIPRAAADDELALVYQPTRATAPLERIPVRAPGPAPAPVDPEWPRPDPVYVAKPGLPFTVLESADADTLFAEADTCTNVDEGYMVTFPESWYTNTAIGDVPACSWFSPTFYEATEGGPLPEEIAIEISVFEGAIGFIWVDLYSEDVVLDGIDARRYETGMTKDVDQPTEAFQYVYLARFDESSEGRKMWAFTGTEYGGDYELNRAVLDRIMASLEFTE
ncbi:MAG: hypothetical protein ACRDGD_07125 [Candidatus Limnocylindria bacterium]